MCLLRVFLMIQLFSGYFKSELKGDEVEPEFNSPCVDNQYCNFFKTGYQCSVCAEDRSGETRCLSTFWDGHWFNGKCSFPVGCKSECLHGGYCIRDENYAETCLCELGFCSRTWNCGVDARGGTYFRMVQWNRENVFAKPGEFKRFKFAITIDSKVFERGVTRMFLTALGNTVFLGDAGQKGHAPSSLSCEESSGPICTYVYKDYVDMQYPYLPPRNERGVTVLKLNDKLKGYLSEIYLKYVYRENGTYNYNTFKVFVNYEQVSVLKCIPIIKLTNCASSISTSIQSVFYRNERITMHYYVKYFEDGAYLSTARENRQKCTSQDTTWTWTWSKCYETRFFKRSSIMIEQGVTIGESKSFEKFTLGFGTYRMNLRIKRVIDGSTNENYDECYFKVNPLPLRAYIDGPEVRTVIKDFGLGLTANNCYDPNEPLNEQQDLTVFWTCECKTKNIVNCENTCQITKKNIIWLTVREEFYLSPAQLQYGAEYDFTLVVNSRIKYNDKNIAPQFAHVTVKVANESVKAVTTYFIECLQNCEKDGIRPNEVLFLKVKISVSGKSRILMSNNVVNESIKFTWLYSKAHESVLQPVDNITLTNDLPSTMLAIKEDAFEQGCNYLIVVKDEKGLDNLAQYTFKTLAMNVEGNCTVEPKSGVKGLTSFKISCDGFEGLYFEFYDKSEEDLKENVIFNGRMLGASEFHGILHDVKITRGFIEVYVINKRSGLYIRKDLTVKLSPLNDTGDLMHEIEKNLTSALHLDDLTTVMNCVSYIPNILPKNAAKEKVLGELLNIISQVNLETVADVKLSVSTMKIVLQTLNQPTTLKVDLELIWFTLRLVKKQADIILNTAKQRGISEWMSTREVKLVSTALLECLNTALKCEGVSTTGLSEGETTFDKMYLLRQNSQENGGILDNIKDTLSYIHAAGLPPNKLATTDKFFQVWSMGNAQEYPVSEMLKKDNSIPFNISQYFLQSFSKASKKYGTQLFFQAARIEKNVFSWSKSDVKSKLVSLSMAVKRGGQKGLMQIKMLSSPVFVRIGMDKNITNTIVKGSTRQLDPKLDPVTLDMSIPVHKIDLPPKGYITIRFLYPPTNESLRVILMDDFRPDYEFMTNSKDVFIINSSYTNYPIKHWPFDLPMLLYLGVLPHENVKVNQTVKYEFEVTINLCQLWVEGQWSSIGCWVTETTSNETVCACKHLSIFAAALPVPPNRIDPIEDAKLFLTVMTNPLVVVFVIVVFIMYLFLILWGRYKDNVDKFKGKVVVLADNFPEDSYPYLVAVVTSARFNAGTTAHVGIKLIGINGESHVHILSSDRRKVLTRDSDDWFLIYTAASLGSIYGIHLWHDNYGSSPEWFCERIVVYDLTHGTEAVFIVDQWLALREGDFVEANLVIATGQEILNIKRIFVNNSVLGFRDSHTYVSIFVRHPRSDVTRVQRLSVLMCTIMVAMLCSIMFYVPEDDDSRTDDFHYDLCLREVIISVQTLIITAALTLVVLLTFKRSHDVVHQPRRSTLQFRKDEVAEQVILQSEVSASHLSALIHIAEGQQPGGDNSFYKSYTRYVTRYLKGPTVAPVYMWEGEKRVKKRMKWYIVAWTSCILISVGSAYLVMLYGLKLGPVQSEKWLTSLVMSMGEDMFIMGPGRIILVAIMLSMAFQVSTKVDIHGISVKDALCARPKYEIEYFKILLAKRNHPMYAPLSTSTRWAMLQKQNLRLKWWSLVDFLNAVIFTIIVSMVIYRLWISHYHGVEQLRTMFSLIHRGSHGQRHIEDIKNLEMVEHYLEFTFVEVLFNLWWYNDQRYSYGAEPDGIGKYWIDGGLYKTISKPLVRQVRVVHHTCRNKFFNTTCLLEWSFGNEDTNVYGEKWVPATYVDTTKPDSPWEYKERSSSLWWTNARFYGKFGKLYDIGGFGTLIGPTLKEAQKTLAELRETVWQDLYTRACFLQTSVYNVNDHTFTQITTLFEYYVDGSVFTNVTVIPVSRTIQFGVWESLFFLYAVYYVFRSGYLINRMGLLGYLKNLNNLTRVINVFLSFLAIIIWAVHHQTSIKYSENYLKGEDPNIFDFDKFISTFRLLQFVLSLLLCFSIARCFMCMRGGRRLLNAYYTFIISRKTVFWLAILFLMLVFLLKRLQYLMDCQEYFRTKELTLPVKMTHFLSPTPLENFNTEAFVVLRVILMSSLNAMFVVSYLYLIRVAKAYKRQDSDSFNFVLFVKDRVKVFLIWISCMTKSHS